MQGEDEKTFTQREKSDLLQSFAGFQVDDLKKSSCNNNLSFLEKSGAENGEEEVSSLAKRRGLQGSPVKVQAVVAESLIIQQPKPTPLVGLTKAQRQSIKSPVLNFDFKNAEGKTLFITQRVPVF